MKGSRRISSRPARETDGGYGKTHTANLHKTLESTGVTHVQPLDRPYDADFVAWADRQAGLLRAGNLAEADIEHIAEELEGLANSDRRALASHVRNILVHLIKLRASPATGPRAGWEETIANARAEIEVILEASPSLRREFSGIVEKERRRATRIARIAMAHYGERDPANMLSSLRLGPDEVLGLPDDYLRSS